MCRPYGMAEAADTNLRQVVLFFMSCWISFGSRFAANFPQRWLKLTIVKKYYLFI